ncbi:hypothetical protein [Azotobacter beijerinckii]|uniref:Uncharacterized protein n=1 Tax=Azotobacter beijerinckii TaxID=170623 RepID=A0A1I0Z1J3_9GAMM|nr:hypothetical protein [Azotobacter beijerinckii]SFB19589.1 hypothetical protein SAMN04244571_01743 [Azotobacter beijerinckii]
MRTPQAALKKHGEDLVALRDEIAMRTLQTLIMKDTWGKSGEDGKHVRYTSMRDFSKAAYEFADCMLEARNG